MTPTTLPVDPTSVAAPAGFASTHRELKQGAFFNTLALITTNFRSLFTFLVARLLGPAALGIFSVAWATTDFCSKIGIFGLDDTATTFIARAEATGDHARSRRMFRLAVVLGVTFSGVVAVALIVTIYRYGRALGLAPEMVSSVTVVLCALPGIALYRISTSASRGMKVMQHDIYSRGITDSAATTLAFLIALAIGFNRFAPPLAAIIGSTASGLVALYLAARLFRTFPRTRALPDASEKRELLSYSAPICGYQFLNAFIVRLDVIMLAWFIGRAPGVTLTTVGVYTAVVDVASSARKVSGSFYPILAPVIAGITARGQKEDAMRAYGRVAQWMLWVLLPLSAVTLLSGEAILAIYGPVFRQGSSWLAVATLGCATNAFVGLGETIIMVQRPRFNLLNSTIAGVVAVVANLLLIPRFGVMGAALGLLIPYLVQGILRYGMLRFIFHWKSPWQDVAPPFVSAIIALVPAMIARSSWPGIAGQIAAGSIFLVIFGGAWIYWHYWRRADIS